MKNPACSAWPLARANQTAVRRSYRVVLLFVVLSAVVVTCGNKTMTAPVSGFKPLQPEQIASSGSLRDPLLVAETDSLQPMFEWTPFPGIEERIESKPGLGRKIKVVPFVEIHPSRLSGITYTLRIWDPNDGMKLAYQKAGLSRPEHRIEKRLKSGTLYFWSVRARLRVNGIWRLTDWSMTQVPVPYNEAKYLREHLGVRGMRFYSAQARDVAQTLGHIPYGNFYRFKTPEGEDE